MSDSPIAYIKADCQEVINRAQTIIGTKEIEMLTHINLAYQNFRPRWWNFDRFPYDKNDRVSKFYDYDGLKIQHPSIYTWVIGYHESWDFGYLNADWLLSDYRRLEKMAQFSMECGEDVMFLSEDGARILGI